MLPNKVNTKELEINQNNIIENSKVTVNSISLQFKNTTNITEIKCYHFKQANQMMVFLGVPGQFELLDSKTIHPDTNHISFHFLQSCHKYKIVFYNNNQQIITEKEYMCIDNDIEYNLSPDSIDIIEKTFGLPSSLYISPNVFDLNCDKNDYKLISTPMCLNWIIDTKYNECDWMWYAIKPNDKNQTLFVRILLLNSLFALPHGSVAQKLIHHFGDEALKNEKIKMLIQRYSHQVMLCPNPLQRQVIDFRVEKDGKKTVNWARNKKLKRFKNDFYLSVNYKFKEHLKLCKDYHIEKELLKKEKEKESKENENKQEDNDGNKEDGTWITDNFIDILDEMRRNKNENDVLKFVTFELWEKETNCIAAASFAYIIGSVLCDYTFMTLVKDNRSCGSILTKVIGNILQLCKYDMWYWGFRLDYMNEYDKYGGKEVHRTDFANVLKNSCKQQPKIVNCNDEAVLDIIEFIKTGKALIQPLPQWVNNK